MQQSSADETFDRFASQIDTDLLIDQVVSRTDSDPDNIANSVHTSLEEAQNALRLLWEFLPKDRTARILEVGAGIGILSNLIASMGYQVVALEPGGVGFEIHQPLAHAVGAIIDGQVSRIDIGAESLNRDDHGLFDFVFSINVIEHVEDVSVVLTAARSILAPDGLMLHSCPNYAIPYDPHFALPLIPFKPSATARLLPKKISESELWRSLNFITSGQVRRYCGKHGLEVKFHTGQMARAVRRLATDPEFAERQKVLVPIAKIIRRTGALALLARLPATATTPMVFVIHNSQPLSDT